MAVSCRGAHWKNGVLRPPPLPVGFTVGEGHLDFSQNQRFHAPDQKPGIRTSFGISLGYQSCFMCYRRGPVSSEPNSAWNS